jgi:predicted nucleic acid-binding protein
MANRDKHYWDASVVCALIMAEEGRVDACRALVQAAEQGQITIITSALTIAEVTGGQRTASRPEVHAAIREFFSQPFVSLMSVDRFVAERAQQLRIDRLQQRMRKLPGNDAIHLATALMSDVDELFSYDDDDLCNLTGVYLTNAHRSLTIRHPFWAAQSILVLPEVNDSNNDLE